MRDTLICVDMDHDPDKTGGAPILDGDKESAIWALYEVLDDDGSDVWPVKFHAKGLTFKQAEDMADAIGLSGRRIS